MSWIVIIALALGLAAGVVAGLGVLLWTRRRQFPTIMTPDGRRAWAFIAILGGCVVFTIFAAVGVWLVSKNALYTLILALAAHLQILVGLTAMGFVLGRRMQVEGGKDGFKLSDGEKDAALGAQLATNAATSAGQAVTDTLEGKMPERPTT